MPGYRGSAVMYMRMPMCSVAFPISGQCEVNDDSVTLKFPFSSIGFSLPNKPQTGKGFSFRMSCGACEATVSVDYEKDLRGFKGKAVDDSNDQTLVTFNFAESGSAMAELADV